MRKYLSSLRKLFTEDIPKYNAQCLEGFDPNKDDYLPTFYLKGYSSGGKIEFNYGDKGVGYKGNPFFVASRGGGGFKARNGLSLVFIKDNKVHEYMYNELMQELNTHNTQFNIEEKTGDNESLIVVHFYLTPELYEKKLSEPILIDNTIVLSTDKSASKIRIEGGSIESIYYDIDKNCFAARLSNNLEKTLKRKIGKKIKLEVGGQSIYGIYEPFLNRFCFAYLPMQLEKNIQNQL